MIWLDCIGGFMEVSKKTDIWLVRVCSPRVYQPMSSQRVSGIIQPITCPNQRQHLIAPIRSHNHERSTNHESVSECQESEWSLPAVKKREPMYEPIRPPNWTNASNQNIGFSELSSDIQSTINQSEDAVMSSGPVSIQHPVTWTQYPVSSNIHDFF